jgi:protein-disulfide isomerase
MGVRGTPAFLVNGVPLAGAYPYEDFKTVIEGVLAGKF